MILRVLCRLAVQVVLSAAAPLQGAHWLACQRRFAGGQHAARIPCCTLLRTASLHFVRRSTDRSPPPPQRSVPPPVRSSAGSLR
ncbi:hypothetical protein D3870_18255 [Noviherbaspirillum cavernae]|uniref:Uncharacterized protein n=1 Tax=Noviherbaspirillum cavernae TaxID=2320862 RepID=A0A418X5H3_9BURK|nr:hypothetical protein D3870_18255 [Noviherbaspirillum cavernae]